MTDLLRSLRVLALFVACTAPVLGQAQQRNTQVSRADSLLRLDMPDLETGREVFLYFGWGDNFATETSFAAVIAPNNMNPHAAVVMQQLSKGYRWRASSLDEARIRSVDPWLRDKRIQMIQSARDAPSGFLQYALFTADNVACLAFDFRRVTPGGKDGGGEAGFAGVYCTDPRGKLGEDDVARVVSGIYVNNKGELRRAYEVAKGPIPDRVRR